MKYILQYRSPINKEEIQLAELRARAMKTSLEKINRFDEERAKQRLLGNFDKESTTVIETENGNVVGFYCVIVSGCNAKIDHLYLDIAYQGQGIGSEVLTKICKEYSEYDISLIALKESNSNDFYIKNGFKYVGSIEWDNQYQKNRMEISKVDNMKTNQENLIVYREMVASDLAEMSSVFCETFSAPPWNEPWTCENAFKRLEQMILFPGQKSYVAIQNDKIVAFCVGTIMNWHDSGYFDLREFCVKPDYKRKGIGSNLLKNIEIDLNEKGVSNIILFTTRNSDANLFYRKNGYEQFEEMEILKK